MYATTLFLSRRLHATLLAHAQASFPQEACGLLGGAAGRVTHLYVVENQLHSATAFMMQPRQQVEALLHLAAQGVELLAIYHSHPHGAARLSITDVASVTYPEAAHVIIGLGETPPQVRAFGLRNGRFSQIPLMVE